MNITNEQLLSGCLLSSIAHGIMTNVHPELDYEQSWDGCNFSAIDDHGRRGTITFTDGACVGAIRDDHGTIIRGLDSIREYAGNPPSKIWRLAENEALQYLLDEYDCEVIPCVTTFFWCDNKGIHIGRAGKQNFQEDMSLFRVCCLPFGAAVGALQKYYDMDEVTVGLLVDLFEQKNNCLAKAIDLTEKQKSLLPGNNIYRACVESLAELKIFV